VDPTKLTRIVEVIFDGAAEFLDMTRFPTADKGVFGPLLRIQQALMTVQWRRIAAEEQLRKSLETIVTTSTSTTPTSLERLRTQELMMRDFVQLVELERSRYLPRGDQEDYWGNQFIQHLNKAMSSDGFPNPATRANVVDKMRALVQTRRNGHAITLESLWDQLRSAFVNSSDAENFDDELKQLTTVVPARVMLAQPLGALSDLNSRDQMVQTEDKARYEKLEAENAALRNQVNQMNASAEFHKKKRPARTMEMEPGEEPRELT
jgi:hypothetical protein